MCILPQLKTKFFKGTKLVKMVVRPGQEIGCRRALAWGSTVSTQEDSRRSCTPSARGCYEYHKGPQKEKQSGPCGKSCFPARAQPPEALWGSWSLWQHGRHILKITSWLIEEYLKVFASGGLLFFGKIGVKLKFCFVVNRILFCDI